MTVAIEFQTRKITATIEQQKKKLTSSQYNIFHLIYIGKPFLYISVVWYSFLIIFENETWNYFLK